MNPQGLTLFIQRAKDPAKGKLALPGGFVDYGETAEMAVRREAKEEVNLELDGLVYLCSALNEYRYQDVDYPVLDLFFVASVSGQPTVAALDGVASYHWVDPAAIDPEDLAFPSIRAAQAAYLLSRQAANR